ncbi:hypothetical protein Bca52824_070710 [Brassica carinata]|uniref:C2H2-type domain-containing protein n=1 Tax=Brassica carinata TaxID=52824 RepID=A0A8X7U5C2_BRACI|nr:hypothetical protein Bca52824_070710 [Brassica carinata]
MMYSLLNETRNCQVCKKSFPNGRALGGHMRSHSRKISASNAKSATGSTVPTLKTPTKLAANIRPNETVLMRSVHTSEVGREPDLKREKALGGHRTSHKTKRLKICDKNGQAMVRHYKCEICGRVFESGQALGGLRRFIMCFYNQVTRFGYVWLVTSAE